MSVHLDPLTQLPDRKVLEADLQSALHAGDGVALALLDLDRFLEINTDFGPESGDRVLQTMGALLQEKVPGQCYRISGDEFALLMPGTGLEQAFLKLEEVRAFVESSRNRFEVLDGREISITAGVAQCPRDAKDEAGLMRAADAAMMAAKEEGRNRVALPPNEDMVMKSCYYGATSVRKLKALAERLKRKESFLLREALDDLLRKHDQR
jgi:diguanylate cyclase (GGDEF)-like protein